MKRKVSNPLALTVMSYLTTKPMHRYDLVRTMRNNADDRSVKFTPASVYMVVEQLERAGFIVEHETLRTGGYPERVVYALTPEGHDEWRSWLRELIADPAHEYPQFVLALSLMAALEPRDAVTLLAGRRDRVAALETQTQAAMDEALAGGLPPLFLADESFRLAMLATERRFISDLIDRIEDPETGWAAPWAEALAHARGGDGEATDGD